METSAKSTRKKHQLNRPEFNGKSNGKTTLEFTNKSSLNGSSLSRNNVYLAKAIARKTNFCVLLYIQKLLSLSNINKLIFTKDLKVHTNPSKNHPVKILMENYNIRAILDLNLVNRHRKLNRYFKAVNNLLPDAGLYITCFESHRQRNLRVYGTSPALTDKLRILLSYLVHRLIPRIGFLKKAYYNNCKKEPYRYLPTSEVLGRLAYCGFDIIEYRVICNMTYCVLMKTREPSTAGHADCGFIIKLNRVGKEGKMMHVYKVRTMHPYSEYLQDYLVKHNGYSGKGKPANDFRVTYYGKFFRKFWLDELPQLINVFKNEMKIVGVRPISLTKFFEMPADLRELRIKHKPGCIPPYVSLNDPSKEGNEKSERTYLKDIENSSFTDLRYLCKALYNIIFQKIHSE